MKRCPPTLLLIVLAAAATPPFALQAAPPAAPTPDSARKLVPRPIPGMIAPAKTRPAPASPVKRTLAPAPEKAATDSTGPARLLYIHRLGTARLPAIEEQEKTTTSGAGATETETIDVTTPALSAPPSPKPAPASEKAVPYRSGRALIFYVHRGALLDLPAMNEKEKTETSGAGMAEAVDVATPPLPLREGKIRILSRREVEDTR